MTTSSKRIIIIGGGIGGLATANLLAEAGHHVTVYEKDDMLGGRAGRRAVDGYVFDTGPSWYLMPDVFDHYYELLHESTDTWLQLEKLEPAYKVFFENDPNITITSDIKKDMATFESIEAGAGKALEKYVERSNIIYKLSLNHFLYSNFERLSDFLHIDIFKKIFQLPKLLIQPIDSYVSGFVKQKRLQQILEYPMVFLGTSPFTAPSMYSLMSALDFKEGVFYPQGGLYTIIESLVTIGKQRGVVYHLNTPIQQILTHDGAAIGIQINDHQKEFADIVISNADLHYTETQLLKRSDQTYPESYWRKKEAGPSALLLYLGVSGKIPEFEHHNLLLVDDWHGNFSAIYDTKTAPEKASIYICKSSQTDDSVAPKGDENVFVLVPLPAGIDWNDSKVIEMTDYYLDQITEMTGVNLAERLVVKEVFGPNDFQTKFHSWQSSMLGQSHLLRQSAFFRTPNKSKKVANLYYVGGSTTPGIGLPMCLIGAELVYKRIIGEKTGGRVKSIEKVDTAI